MPLALKIKLVSKVYDHGYLRKKAKFYRNFKVGAFQP